MEPCIVCSKEAMFRLKAFRGNGAKRRQRGKQVWDEHLGKKRMNRNRSAQRMGPGHDQRDAL